MGISGHLCGTLAVFFWQIIVLRWLVHGYTKETIALDLATMLEDDKEAAGLAAWVFEDFYETLKSSGKEGKVVLDFFKPKQKPLDYRLAKDAAVAVPKKGTTSKPSEPAKTFRFLELPLVLRTWMYMAALVPTGSRGLPTSEAADPKFHPAEPTYWLRAARSTKRSATCFGPRIQFISMWATLHEAFRRPS